MCHRPVHRKFLLLGIVVVHAAAPLTFTYLAIFFAGTPKDDPTWRTGAGRAEEVAAASALDAVLQVRGPSHSKGVLQNKEDKDLGNRFSSHQHGGSCRPGKTRI